MHESNGAAADFADAEPMPANDAAPAVVPWPTIREQLGALAGQAPPLPTGLAPLDIACRGGLRRSRVVVVAGAPGAGKTTLCVMVAHDLAAQGVHVAVLAADEAALGLVGRVGQLLGEERDAIESGDSITLERVAVASETSLASLAILDGPTTNQGILDMARELSRRAPSSASVLVVDSIQSVARSPRYADVDGVRGRVDAVMADLRATAAAGHIVIATSEVGRAYYRGGSDAPPDPLAAAKESGGVEYATDVLVVLASVAGEHGQVDATIAKNRTGQRAEWRMRLDYGRARFDVIERPPVASREDKQAMKATREAAAIARHVAELPAAILRSRVPITSLAELVAIMGGRAVTCRAAVTRALAEGGIFIEAPPLGRRGKGVYRVAGSSSAAPTTEPVPVGPSRSRTRPVGTLATTGPTVPPPIGGPVVGTDSIAVAEGPPGDASRSRSMPPSAAPGGALASTPSAGRVGARGTVPRDGGGRLDVEVARDDVDGFLEVRRRDNGNAFRVPVASFTASPRSGAP